jgi:hypothetical protein
VALAVAYPVVARAVQALSAEFQADEKAAAVSSADFPADDYSQAACPDIAEAAAPVAEQLKADEEHCDCLPEARCDFPALQTDYYPAEQADYQELRGEEHFHLLGHREHCCLDRRYLAHHYSDHLDAGHCDYFPQRRDVRHCSVVQDCSAVQDAELRRGCPARSVDRPVDQDEELRRDSLVRWTVRLPVLDEGPHRDFRGRSVVRPVVPHVRRRRDCRVGHSEHQDGRPRYSAVHYSADHHELRVVMVVPVREAQLERSLPEQALDEQKLAQAPDD